MENKYNLIDERWIPTTNKAYAGLSEIFSDRSIRFIGGNPVEKISLLKFFLAIAQRALDIETQAQLTGVTNEQISEKCLAYLESQRENFFLFGKRPFLQLPQIYVAKVKTFSEVSIEIATGNTSVLYSSQRERDFSNNEQALLLLTLQSFATGGKKPDNSVVLTPGYMGKQNEKGNPSSSKSGPSLGFKGYLHSFVLGETLLDTIRLNLFSEETIKEFDFLSEGIGIPPWEEMPTGEADEIARRLKNTYMGRLVPMSRFIYLVPEGMHYSEGLAHPTLYDGVYDLSMSVNFSKKKPTTLWADPDFHPWRHLASLLSFLDEEENKDDIFCAQLKNGFLNAKLRNDKCSIWSGGLKLSSKAGEQYCSGSDDYVESQIPIDEKCLSEEYYGTFRTYFEILKKYEAVIYFSTRHYCEDLKIDHAKYCNKAKQIYWQFIERNLDLVIEHIFADSEKDFRKLIFKYVRDTYDLVCPASTESRIISWAKNNPTIHRGGNNNGRKSEA